jgi:hypothetical protein
MKLDMFEREELEDFYKHGYFLRTLKTLENPEHDFQNLIDLVNIYKRSGASAAFSYFDFLSDFYPKGLDWFLTIAVIYGNRELIAYLVCMLYEIGVENYVEQDVVFEDE